MNPFAVEVAAIQNQSLSYIVNRFYFKEALLLDDIQNITMLSALACIMLVVKG